MLRRAWERLIRKQCLILYPLVLGIINALAFAAVYVATGGALTWSAGLTADLDRWSYVRDYVMADLSWTPALAVVAAAGIAVCALAAFVRAPYFRAIAGMGYPLLPRNGREVGHLFLLYIGVNTILWVIPMVIPETAGLREVLVFVTYLIVILVVFADYVIVFEQKSLSAALLRSLRLVRQRWILVLALVIVAQLAYGGLHSLYESYYTSAEEVFALLPISRVLVNAFVVLVVDLVLIFTYQQQQRAAPR